jgi:hypothetical protein
MTFKKFIISLPIAALAAVSTTNPQVMFQISDEADEPSGKIVTGIEQIDGNMTVSADILSTSDVLSELQTVEGGVDYCQSGLVDAGIDDLVRDVGLGADESCTVFLSIIEPNTDPRRDKVAFFDAHMPGLTEVPTPEDTPDAVLTQPVLPEPGTEF